ALVEHYGYGDVAAEAQPAPSDHADGIDAADDPAVLVQPPRRHIVDRFGGAGGEPDQRSILDDQDGPHTGRPRERRMRGKVDGLAMDRNSDSRTQPGVHRAELLAARVA